MKDAMLYFVFYGFHRAWRPLRGLEAKFAQHGDGEVFVVHSLPGNIVAWGESWDEASKKLCDRIDNAMKRHGNTAVWWKDAMTSMDDEDRRMFGEVWSKGMPARRTGINEADAIVVNCFGSDDSVEHSDEAATADCT